MAAVQHSLLLREREKGITVKMGKISPNSGHHTTRKTHFLSVIFDPTYRAATLIRGKVRHLGGGAIKASF